jgi:4-hydroxybenzoate polyprenyltransferase
LLHEAALQFVARHPFEAWRLLTWMLGGKAHLKGSLAGRVENACASAPLRDEVVALIREAQAEGRPVYLASASDQRFVAAVAERVGGIAGTFGTENGTNLSGAAKAKRLNETFGQGGYDYVGNGAVDYPIWRSAREVLVVSGSGRFSGKVRREFPQARVVAEHRLRKRDYFRALRTHQWAKNVLVFLPLIAGHTIDPESIGDTVIAFACFCLAASSAYIINDLLDLPGDRSHARKRNRPFAAGAIPTWHGPPMALLLLGAAFGAALLLPPWFALVLALYVVLTLAYSLYLKRKILIDVIVLAGLYTIRVLGGVAAVGVEQSPWLLMLSLFLFLSLAIVKRCSELVAQRAAGEEQAIGRGYRVEDLGVMLGLGAAAGYSSVLVVALYIFSPHVQLLYRNPQWLWLICPLQLYWVSRTLMLASRDAMHDDPVVYALTDRTSWLVGALAAAVIAISA